MTGSIGGLGSDHHLEPNPDNMVVLSSQPCLALDFSTLDCGEDYLQQPEINLP